MGRDLFFYIYVMIDHHSNHNEPFLIVEVDVEAARLTANSNNSRRQLFVVPVWEAVGLPFFVEVFKGFLRGGVSDLLFLTLTGLVGGVN
jgi:hypothetical protein